MVLRLRKGKGVLLARHCRQGAPTAVSDDVVALFVSVLGVRSVQAEQTGELAKEVS